MGGKSKQSQRTKNNARPSNSGRSAELLGATVPSFVGFTTHSDFGMVPLAPGFAIAENLPDTFDANISSQFQMVFRKMSKKDPITKAKALQEFSELINESDLNVVKTVLPLWPKFYGNLANDVEHRVRETAQQAQSTVIEKSGKVIAPYLKQLIPVWLASQFDNYAPAASAALTTFRQSFAPHKVQEVYSFCQNEILEYISKNLLYHTPSTINNTKTLTPEDAENKYNRIVVCSLKLFSLYLEKINSDKIQEADDKIKNILQNPKFYTFAKNKDHKIKSAWFELLYTFLQNYPQFLEVNKQQCIQIVFQHIDDTDPLTVPHVWGCVLLIQTRYDDWYTFLNFKKAIQPKLFSLIRSNCNGCASLFYPNLFPFISKLTNEILQNSNSTIQEFYIELFDTIKLSIMNLKKSDSNKSEITAIIIAFYECIRYIIQKENKTNEYGIILCETLIENYLIKLIEWCFQNNTIAIKLIFSNISSFIVYLTQNSENSKLYLSLLKRFWLQLNEIVTNLSKTNRDDDDNDEESDDDDGNHGDNDENCINIDKNSKQLQRCLELIQCLYNASENHTNTSNQKVKFVSPDEIDTNKEGEMNSSGTVAHTTSTSSSSTNHKSKTHNPIVLKELRIIAVQLAQTYIQKISKEKTIEFVPQLKQLIKMFGDDVTFYLDITKENDLKSVFKVVSDFLTNDYGTCDSMMDIVFEILILMDKNDRIENIEKLLKIPNSTIQQWIINRLLSYPLCVEPEIREILSKSHVSELILNFARDFIRENSKEKFNLLHKCFFQIDSGEILIDQKTIEGIVRIMFEPITQYEIHGNHHQQQHEEEHQENDISNEILDTCCSFIAQIMPVICSNNADVSKKLQNDIFLKLFKFSIEMIGSNNDNENLSEDTLWEIITCWQDALSSNDIQIVNNNELLEECSKIIKNRIIQYDIDEISITDITNISDLTAKLIICSIESIQDDNERLNNLDNLLLNLLDHQNDKEYLELCENIEILCSHFELINGLYTKTKPKEYKIIKIPSFDIRNYFRKEFFNFIVICKLICNIKTDEEKLSSKRIVKANEEEKDNEEEDVNDDGNAENNEKVNDIDIDDDQEYTDDYIDPNEHILKSWSNSVYEHLISSLKTSSLGESLLLNSYMFCKECEDLILNLTEKINLTLKNLPELFISTLKDKIFNGINSDEISSIRILNFLCGHNKYADIENGPVLLLEDAGNHVLDKNDIDSYLNITQIMLKKLPSRSLPINYDMLDENTDISIRMAYLRCLISNHFSGSYNEISDRKIITFCLKIIQDIDIRKSSDKTLLLYNDDISKHDIKKVFFVTELINFLTEILYSFPTQLDIKCWDLIRIGFSSWVLSISKSIDQWYDPKVSIFISSIYKLFLALSKFIRAEKTKSSTQELTNIIDEWENVFALEVNLILFKSYLHLVTCENGAENLTSQIALLDIISPTIEYLDYSIIFNASQNKFKYSTDDIIKFCLENLSNNIHNVRITSMIILKNLIPYLVSIDIENLDKRNALTEKTNKEIDNSINWHLIHKFVIFLRIYEAKVEEYLTDFDYKLTDLQNFRQINRDDALTYFYLWHCVIFTCLKSPAELRSLYASTLRENKLEQVLLNFLFRSMPIEILKNHDSKIINNEIFKTMDWEQIKDRNISVEKFACHIYTQMLKYLPAIVRKWWNATNARQKVFIDKLTTNFVSSLICNEELRAISKHEKLENMKVTVHISTREVNAVYSIDEARMELNIILAPNHPLGTVKVENIKQIGSRAQSRDTVMLITKFLTHQNGSIFDCLTIWRRNLDKKFEGVEECYVCYAVIHQDSCQLPKLQCKTCKKKFHGPCLYKWFTTSSKSTCPICRNVF